MKRCNGTWSIYKFIDDFPSYKPPFMRFTSATFDY